MLIKIDCSRLLEGICGGILGMWKECKGKLAESLGGFGECEGTRGEGEGGETLATSLDLACDVAKSKRHHVPCISMMSVDAN